MRGTNVALRSAPARDAEWNDTLQLGDAIYITGDAETEEGDSKTITADTLGVTRVWFVPVMVVDTGSSGWVAEQYIDPRTLQQLPRPAEDAEDIVGPSYGTRESPVRLADSVVVGGWEVDVRGIRIASYDELLEENPFNDPPLDGLSFVMLDVSLSNRTESEGMAFGALHFGVLGPSKVAHGRLDEETFCGAVPDELDEMDVVFPDGTIRGNLCFQLDQQELGSTLFYVLDGSSSDGERVWFSLD
jgi:predicted aspartyl protease